MHWPMIALRLVHLVSGALWVGMMAFTVVFLTRDGRRPLSLTKDATAGA